MRKLFLATAAVLGMTFAYGAEGVIGSQAYAWTNYKALDSVTYPSGVSLSTYLGKVVLLAVFQYNCAGCDANAPLIGRIADSIGSGKSGVPFQSIGTEIDNGTFGQIQASYNVQLKKNAPNINCPLLHVPFDSAITTDVIGTIWHRYNSHRDVYFIIDATGKITDTVQGNRVSVMSTASYTRLKNAIAADLATVPILINPVKFGNSGLNIYRQGGTFYFSLSSGAQGPVTLQILDLQGRMLRAFSIPVSSKAAWNGLDAGGHRAPFGTYFIKANGAGISESQRISWLP